MKRPFWMHQAVEYILGIVLVAQGLQVPKASEAVIPAVSGVLILVNAAIVRGGALSAFRIVSRAMHRILDLVVLAVVVVLAVQPWLPVDSGARLVMLAIAAVMGFVWWQSSFVEKTPRGRGASGAGASGESEGAADRSSQVGRIAGRLVGDGINATKRAAAKRSAGRGEPGQPGEGR